eukprot:TRINITY_DN7114_c0_g1_i2.p1 TRINITY_DN7114_c0_g1~~TRINITY_DN7114_c0_g1_i2.p1  ORF type:complete len:233 (-),score=43.30 TRINITY_DN7114_c0_g1_i2:91-789(-)
MDKKKKVATPSKEVHHQLSAIHDLAPDVYIPKVGDKAVYYKDGHSKWEEMKEETCRLNLKTFPDVATIHVTACQVLPDCSVSVAFHVVDRRTEFKLDYIAKQGIEFTPFIVPYKSYQEAISRKWKVGDKCGMKFDDGIVYSGVIEDIVGNGKVWESVTVHWDVDDTVTQVNIWELLKLDKVVGVIGRSGEPTEEQPQETEIVQATPQKDQKDSKSKSKSKPKSLASESPGSK